MRQIGQALRVSHVVEGSVQRTGNRVRVNAQLVDARTDTHLWARTIRPRSGGCVRDPKRDRKEIAEQLHAKLSPREETAIERTRPADSPRSISTRAPKILLTPALDRESGFAAGGRSAEPGCRA